jgi:hypothetical protein
MVDALSAEARAIEDLVEDTPTTPLGHVLARVDLALAEKS